METEEERVNPETVREQVWELRDVEIRRRIDVSSGYPEKASANLTLFEYGEQKYLKTRMEESMLHCL